MEKIVILGLTQDIPKERLWKIATHRTGIPLQVWEDMIEYQAVVDGDYTHQNGVECAKLLQADLRHRTVIMLGVYVFGVMRPSRHISSEAGNDQLPRNGEWLRNRDWLTIPCPGSLSHWYDNPVRYEAIAIQLGELIEMATDGEWSLTEPGETFDHTIEEIMGDIMKAEQIGSGPGTIFNGDDECLDDEPEDTRTIEEIMEVERMDPAPGTIFDGGR